MNKKSTLVFLVNQIKSDIYKSTLIDSDVVEQENVSNFAPPERAVQAVLGYARSLEVNDTASMGKIEWLLN